MRLKNTRIHAIFVESKMIQYLGYWRVAHVFTISHKQYHLVISRQGIIDF